MFFISDPPHLIKTLQNNLEISHGHHNTRQLIVSAFFPIVLPFFLLHWKSIFMVQEIFKVITVFLGYGF